MKSEVMLINIITSLINSNTNVMFIGGIIIEKDH